MLEAIHYCKNMSANLIIIDDKTENDYIVDIMKNTDGELNFTLMLVVANFSNIRLSKRKAKN